MEALFDVSHLTIGFEENGKINKVVNDISFSIAPGEILGVVGESGSGKSMTALAAMGLLPPQAHVLNGNISFEGRDILNLDKKERSFLSGNKMSMIFQEPLTSLNPLFTDGNQMDEVFRLHQKASRAKAKQMSVDMLRFVGIPDPEDVYKRYPAALSGGMRQRVMIAMALSCRPKLLIADEPTTALDVTIQKQILKLMKDLRRELGTSIIFITHDLGVVAEMADRVAVMYAGQIVEQASVYDLFQKPLHPYTEGLINSTIRLGDGRRRLPTIAGTVPPISKMVAGCRFHPRCPYATPACRESAPPVIEAEGRMVRCIRYAQEQKQEGGVHV